MTNDDNYFDATKLPTFYHVGRRKAHEKKLEIDMKNWYKNDKETVENEIITQLEPYTGIEKEIEIASLVIEKFTIYNKNKIVDNKTRPRIKIINKLFYKRTNNKFKQMNSVIKQLEKIKKIEDLKREDATNKIREVGKPEALLPEVIAQVKNFREAVERNTNIFSFRPTRSSKFLQKINDHLNPGKS